MLLCAVHCCSLGALWLLVALGLSAIKLPQAFFRTTVLPIDVAILAWSHLLNMVTGLSAMTCSVARDVVNADIDGIDSAIDSVKRVAEMKTSLHSLSPGPVSPGSYAIYSDEESTSPKCLAILYPLSA